MAPNEMSHLGERFPWFDAIKESKKWLRRRRTLQMRPFSTCAALRGLFWMRGQFSFRQIYKATCSTAQSTVWLSALRQAFVHMKLWAVILLQDTTGSGSHLFQSFCNMFSKSSPCLLGQHGSCSMAQQPIELSEKSSQNLRNKWPPHPV